MNDSGLIIGLTGGIGSGKSAAANLFAELGAAIVDTDVIAHDLTGPQGAAMPEIRAVFGDAAVAADGRLDRAAMRRLVFADAAARGRLEGILHPMIRDEADRQTAAALADGAAYVVLVVPLLIESGSYRQRAARIAVVDCSETVQEERVMARSGLTREEARRIIDAQIGRSERLAAADDVIGNEADWDSLRNRVTALHADYCRLAETKKHHGG